MKIGIITILNVNNYGAELQAFALQAKLRSLGHDVEIINYLYYKHPRHKGTELSKSFVDLTLLQAAKEKLFPVVANIKAIPFWKAKKTRDKKFQQFHHEVSILSNEFRSMEDLYNKKNWEYDVAIVGSDQVWNPYSGSNIEPYFLKFIPNNILKVSYASSFGVDKIPTQYHSTYGGYLRGLNAIAVREPSGVKIIEEIIGEKVDWVVDPTFLLSKEEWLDYSVAPAIEQPYLLIYALTDSEYILKIAKIIAKTRGFQIVRLCKNASKEDNDPEIINIIDAGPKEFLGLFAKASYVLTTSFHGLCFSVNFNIPFYSILKKEKTNNSRQLDLLKYLGISDRALFVGDSLPSGLSSDLEFDTVNSKISSKIIESVEYLKSSISNECLSEVSE